MIVKQLAWETDGIWDMKAHETGKNSKIISKHRPSFVRPLIKYYTLVITKQDCKDDLK